MAYLAKPESESIISQLTKAIRDIKGINTENFNNELSQIYNWRTIAQRTEKVYDYAIERPSPNVCDRMKSALAQGHISGFYCLIYLILEFITMALCEYVLPVWNIDVVKDFNSTAYNQNIRECGDHELYVDNTDSRNVKKA